MLQINRLVLALVLIALGGFANAQPANDPNALRGDEFIAGPSKVKVKDHVDWAKGWIAEQLKDPDSARFRNVYYGRSQGFNASEFVCGQVNAKNSYGGYAGFHWFYVRGTQWNEEVDRISIGGAVDSGKSEVAFFVCDQLIPYYFSD